MKNNLQNYLTAPKTYYSYKELLEIYPHLTGYDADTYSRKITEILLQEFNCTNIIPTAGPDSADIICTNHIGERIAVEIKDRSYNKMLSTDYSDHFMEINKLKHLAKRKNDGEFQKMFLLSYYLDGVIKYSNLETDIIQKGIMPCNITTTLGIDGKKDKECVFYKPTKLIYFYFKRVLEENGHLSWYPKFSFQKPDLIKLNQVTLF